MFRKVNDFLKPFRKAIVAVLAPIIVALAARYGLNLDVDSVVIVLTSALTGASVFQVANKPQFDQDR